MKKTYIFWVTLVSIAIFRLIFNFEIIRPDSDTCLKTVVNGSGKIVNEPENKESGQVFVVLMYKITDENSNICSENIKIRAKTKLFPEYKYGDHVKISGKLSKPYNFKSKDGREFNYEGYLAKDDIYYEIKSADVEMLISSEADSFVSKIQSNLFRFKETFVNNLNKVLGEPHSALASGLVVGEKAALGKDLLEQFRIVGLIHIIVLSGFNITIIGEALRRVLTFLPRIWGIVIGGIGIVLFGIMVGGGATVVRSCFMAVIALSADLIRRDYSVIRALMLAGLIMIILNPMTLFYNPSFQLSFLATAGLIILASPIENKLKFITEKFGIRGIVASTLATQVFVSPFILHMMGQISIIGMVVNILVLPFVPITMLTVFFTGIFGMVWQPASLLFGWMSHWLLSYELFMVEQFAKVPYASIDVPIFSAWWVVGFYVIFSAVYVFMKKYTRRDLPQHSSN